jgi:uncharacterized protein
LRGTGLVKRFGRLRLHTTAGAEANPRHIGRHGSTTCPDLPRDQAGQREIVRAGNPTLTERVTMTISMYSTSVPVFKQMLSALSDVLKKAETHATEKNIDPNALLQARLFPDMFPLVRQVQIAADFSKGVTSRLAGVDVPSWPDTEVTFADLQALVAKALAYIGTFEAAQFEGSENKEIVLRPGTPKEKKLAGSAYLQHYGLPQFFFHVTTAYAILRHNGVEIGKRDYMGAY